MIEFDKSSATNSGADSPKAMLRSTIVSRLAARSKGLTADDVGFVVDLVLLAITDRLAEGGRVEIRGFGSFATRLRPPRCSRNPRTGQPVLVDAKQVPCFKMSRELRDRLNASATMKAMLCPEPALQSGSGRATPRPKWTKP